MNATHASSLCFICDGHVESEITNLFDENKVLESGLHLSEVVAQVIGRTVNAATAHSTHLCGGCLSVCNEYDEIILRLTKIKWKMQYQFCRTLPNYHLSYESYNEPSGLKDITPELKFESAGVAKKPPAPMKTLVLPKSKLTPLSANLFISPNKLLPGSINLPLSNKRVVILPDKNIVTSKSFSPATITKVTSAPTNCTITTPAAFTGIMKSETKDAIKHEKEFGVLFADIDEKLQPQTAPASIQSYHSNQGRKAMAAAVRTGISKPSSDKFVISEVEIMQGHGDSVEVDEDTILVEQDGSVIHMVRGGSGDLLFSGGDEISLVMPSEAGESDTEASSHFKVNCQDSNDGSQMELQMSGDDATANALIAASTKKGSTYIKMDSGATFRIKTVNGKLDKDSNSFLLPSSIVERHGVMFKCLLCSSANERTNGDLTDDEQWSDVETFAARDMMEHVKSKHSLRIFICEVCSQVFRKRISLDKHMVDHGKKRWVSGQAGKTKSHQCMVCKKKYSSRSLLEEHMNVHSGLRPHTCEVCYKSFISKYTFQGHMKTHTDRPRPFSCTECEKTFLTFQNLSAHLKTHTGVKEFVCATCDKAFTTQHNLDVHGVVHTGDKPFVCGVCQKAFARRAEIRDHMRTHTGERPFACETCSATFSQRSNLLSHRRATHLHDRRHQCAHCDKRFKRRRLLDYHIKASHTGERPFKCAECSATFIYPEHYKKHTLIHSGTRPYECEVCSRKFTSRDNRNAHRYTHSDKKPYECLVCGAGFMRKPQLYLHMNTQGHLSDMIVVNQARLANTTDKVQASSSAENSIELENNKIRTSRALVETEIKEFFSEDSFMDKITDEPIETESQDCKAEKTTYTEEDQEQLIASAVPQSSKMTFVEGDVNEDHSLLTLTEGAEGEGTMEAADVDALLTQATQVLTTDEDGNLVRIYQIQLPDGKSGWVALDS